MRGNKILLVTLQILFVLTFTLSTLVYGLKQQLLNDNLYKTAIDQSGFYTVVEDVLKQKTTDFVVDLEKQVLNIFTNTNQETSGIFSTVVTYGLNVLFETQTQSFIDRVFDTLQIQNVLRAFIETGIERDIAWLKGETEGGKLFEYIPSTVELDEFRKTTINDLINTAIVDVLKKNNISECTTREAIDSNIELIKQGQAPRITCISKEMINVLKLGADAVVPEETQQTLDTSFDELVSGSPAEEAIVISYDFIYSVAEFKEAAIQARYVLQMVQLYSAIGLGLSVVLLISIGFVAKVGEITKKLLLTVFYGGAFLTLTVLVYYFLLTIYVLKGGMFSTFNAESPILNPTQQLLIAESLNSIVIYYLKFLPIYAFITGIVVTGVSAILILLHRIFGLKKVQAEINKYKSKYLNRSKKSNGSKK